MARECKGICDNEELFSKKRLPWDKGSWCSECGKSVRIPTHKSLKDFYIASTNEGKNERYYDIRGKQVDVLIILPLRQIAWNTGDENGTFIKMIDEIVSREVCPCCHNTCRSGPLSKTKYNELKQKMSYVIDKVGIDKDGKDKVLPIGSKIEWVKKSKEYTHSDRRVGRPRKDKDNEGKKDNRVT